MKSKLLITGLIVFFAATVFGQQPVKETVKDTTQTVQQQTGIYKQIFQADSMFFSAFNTCDTVTYKNLPRRAVANAFGVGNDANNIEELGMQSMLQNSQVELKGSLLEELKSDPAMKAFQNSIIQNYKCDPRFGKIDFKLADKSVIEFGGARWSSSDENWGSLGSKNPLFHGQTLKAGVNELTWAVRHGTVEYSAEIKADGTAVVSYHLNDTFDLRPGGRSEAYNNITTVGGFLYHEVAGGNADLKTSAEWKISVNR